MVITYFIITAAVMVAIYKAARLFSDKRKMSIYHYVEYRIYRETYTTREEGALNDLLGVGLLEQIRERGGFVLYHRSGSQEYIENIIDNRYYDEQEQQKYGSFNK